MKPRILFLEKKPNYKPFPKVMKHKTKGTIVGFTVVDEGVVLHPGSAGYRLFRTITDSSEYIDIDCITLEYGED